MPVYRNRLFTKRDYECTNVVACEAPQRPETSDDRWVLTTGRLQLEGLDHLYTETANGQAVRYYGYL
jgi:hypothetical protein